MHPAGQSADEAEAELRASPAQLEGMLLRMLMFCFVLRPLLFSVGPWAPPVAGSVPAPTLAAELCQNRAICAYQAHHLALARPLPATRAVRYAQAFGAS